MIIAAQLERLVLRQGSQLVSADGAGEGDSPEAELMRRMLDARSAHERALIRGRTRAALATKRAKGLKFGSTAPYGWRLNGERLEPDPEEQRMLKRLHELAAGGRSLRQLVAALTTEGFTPRGQRWHPNSVRWILRATPPSS